MSDPFSAQLRPGDEVLHELDDLVDQIARLADSDLAPDGFFAELLDRAVTALAAVGGAVWLNTDGRLRLQHQANLDETQLAGSPENQRRHEELLLGVMQARDAKIVLPHSGQAADGGDLNPSDFLLVLCPMVLDGHAVGVLELVERAGGSPAAQRGCLHFVSTLCEVAEDFLRNRQFRELRQRESLWDEFDRFVQRVHASLDLKATSYEVANEGQRLAGCDRLTVAIRRGRKFKVLAVSGLDHVDRRARKSRFGSPADSTTCRRRFNRRRKRSWMNRTHESSPLFP